MEKIKKFEKFNQDIDAKDIPTFIKKYGVIEDDYEDIHRWCRDNNITEYEIVGGVINSSQKSICIGSDRKILRKIPYKFGKVDGDFHVYNCRLESLENAPDECKSFNCGGNILTTLKGLPKATTYTLFPNPLIDWDVKVFIHFVLVKKYHLTITQNQLNNHIGGFIDDLLRFALTDPSHEIWDWYTDYMESYEDLNNLQSRLEIITGKVYGEDLPSFDFMNTTVNSIMRILKQRFYTRDIERYLNLPE